MKKLILITGLLIALSGLIKSVDAQTTSVVGYGSNDAKEIRLIDLETGQIIPSLFDSITYSTSFKGLAIDPAGETLYGTDQNGNLYRIEILTGVETLLGDMNIVVPDKTEIEAADFNFDGTELWVTDFDSSTPTIYKINNFDTTDLIVNPISATPVQTVDPGIGGGVVRTMTANTTKDVWLASDNFPSMNFQSIDTDETVNNITLIGSLDHDPSQPPFTLRPKISGMDKSIDGVLYGLSLDGGTYIIDQNSVPSLGPNNDARVELIGTAAGHAWLALAISTADSSGNGDDIPGEIHGTVFCDLNNDGALDVGEPGITAVTVELTCTATAPDGTVSVYTDTQITGKNGLYQFLAVPAGSCVVTVVVSTAPFDKEPGECKTTIDNVDLAPEQIYEDANFCFRELGEIGDTVFYDMDNNGLQSPGEPGIADVNVLLECLDTDGTVLFSGLDTTDSNGLYQFTGVPTGSCTVKVVVETAPEDRELGICDPIRTVQLQPGDVNHDVDFCFKIKPGVIGDLVWCDTDGNGTANAGEEGIEGVEVNLTCTVPGETDYTDMQITDDKGEYLFTGVPPGNCIVEVDLSTVPADKEQCSDSPAITDIIPLGAGQSYLDADFCFKTISSEVGGFVWCDINNDAVQDPGEPGIPLVAVDLVCTAPDGTVYTDTQITNDDGVYLFTDVPAGTFDVTVDVTTVPAGKEAGSCPTTINDDLAAGESYLNADFCFKLICGDCDGKVTKLTLQYNGVNPAVVKVKQKKPEQVIYDSGSPLNNGDQFDIEIANDYDGNLKNTEISIYLGCRLNAKIHTSCSNPIGPGLVSGSFEVITGESRNGGVLCSPQNGDGGKDCCEGKITNLTLQNGGDAGFITVKQKNGDVVYADNVDHLGTFSFIGTDKKGTLGTKISIFVDGCLKTKIHTSCSQLIGIGSVFEGFTVLDGASLKGGPLCPADEIIDDGVDDDSSSSDDDCCEGKVTTLKLENGGASGYILVTQKNGVAVFADNVDYLGAFSIIGTDNGTLGTEITITDSSGVETKIHTSCSNPIGIGSVFGDFTVLEGASLRGGALCPVDELSGDDGGNDDDGSGHHKHKKHKYKKSHSKDSKRSHKNCDKKSHKKHHKKRHKEGCN